MLASLVKLLNGDAHDVSAAFLGYVYVFALIHDCLFGGCCPFV